MRTAPIVAGITGFLACIVTVLVFSERLASRNAELTESRARRASLQRDLTNAHAAEGRALARLELARREIDDARARLAEATNEGRKAGLERDTAQAELLATQDRLEKAYKDIAEMERQIVDVSKAKNEVDRRLRFWEEPLHGVPPSWHPRVPLIEGVVLGVSDKVNLVLISVGKKDQVQVGYKFTVYRGSTYVTKLAVDRVDDTWAACRELEDLRLDEIRQGDTVTTEVK